MKLKKVCTGYRDTNALQIQDETNSVKRKAERENAKYFPQSQSQSPAPPTRPVSTAPSHHLAPPEVDFSGGIPTPASTNSDSTNSSDGTIDIDPLITPYGDGFSDIDPMLLGREPWEIDGFESSLGTIDHLGNYNSAVLTMALQPKPDDVATKYFLDNFATNMTWQFMRQFTATRTLPRSLELAMKAVGMAALGNVQPVAMGKVYAQSMYAEALGLLNDALRDPVRCKTDESLIAVAMLGYYENLTCDGFESIQSWKAHVRGATQLLKLRGKKQFQSAIGKS